MSVRPDRLSHSSSYQRRSRSVIRRRLQRNALPWHPTGKNMMSAVLEQRPSAMQRAVPGDADSFSLLIEPLLDPAYRLAAVMLSGRTAAGEAGPGGSIKAVRKPR